MAAGQNVPELGGYDFEFTSKVPEELESPVCQLTMKDPIQIEGCGHRFCSLMQRGFVEFPRNRAKSHLESHMESPLSLALCSLEITQNQVKHPSKRIERLTSTLSEQSQQLNDQSQHGYIDRQIYGQRYKPVTNDGAIDVICKRSFIANGKSNVYCTRSGATDTTIDGPSSTSSKADKGNK
ncbi:hypothetical protein AWC38_SpisGene16195 [Stylophora pistillata]|uniref:Uncharacterized protein n=1 Tax=Stylophora pistillata TaxID=50429 RepID=A0A2B4RRJ5_STYPI|nr:hypothetical protein AWC38_SpisGene16195 [Stylophora pistillata]